MKHAPKLSYTHQWKLAHDEHAFFLRCEGLSLRQIAKRMGSSDAGYVSWRLYRFSLRLEKALSHPKFYVKVIKK